ncbi:hypothetical protein ACIRL3_38595 [Streptomyces sp. NPDC102384]|uniref:hypothetical protein n=1 Tax=Streptomyces sp. NPDC102384 TaxID=3366166 RepID=UPI0038154037
MSLGQDELRGRAEGRSAYVLRHLGGWLLGTFVILFGLFSGLAGAGALDGHVTVSADPGTFRVQSCELAVDHYMCKGTFEGKFNGQTATGVSLEQIGRAEPGDQLDAYKVPGGYSEFPTEGLLPSELSRGLFLVGSGVVAVTCGLFAVVTGYAPRASYTNRRPDPSYGRISLVQAWRGLGRWGPVRLILCGLAGLGVLIAAWGAVVSLVYR